MSLYIIVEGRRTEPRLLRAWLPLLAPAHQAAARVEDVGTRSYFVVAGFGYPSYHERIRAAVADIQRFPNFSWLVVMVDAEELSLADRRAEVQEVIEESRCPIPSVVLVADCCVETWLLGNRKMVRPQASTSELQAHLAHYDVRRHDPERMPLRSDYERRAPHHFDYLRAVFAERDMAFSKAHPGHAASPEYLHELRGRTKEKDEGGWHLASFRELLLFFEELQIIQPGLASLE